MDITVKNIILLRGYSHSGKDFVGEILCKQYGFYRFAFADSLKKIVNKKYGCSLDILHSQEGKLLICENDTEKRTYRQILLDEALCLKSDNPDIFAEFCCQEILETTSDKIVITDWRFPNERDVILKTFPNATIHTIKVLRVDQDKSPVNDTSEYLLKNWKDDAIIINYMNNLIYQAVNNTLQKLDII
jgi:hypothetical protein